MSSVPATAPNVFAAYTLPMDSCCGASAERNFSIAGTVAPIAIVAGSSTRAGTVNAINQCWNASGASPMRRNANSFAPGIKKLISNAHAPMVSSNPPSQKPARALRGMKRSSPHAPSAMPAMKAAMMASIAGISCPSPVENIFAHTSW